MRLTPVDPTSVARSSGYPSSESGGAIITPRQSSLGPGSGRLGVVRDCSQPWIDLADPTRATGARLHQRGASAFCELYRAVAITRCRIHGLREREVDFCTLRRPARVRSVDHVRTREQLDRGSWVAR